MNPEINRERKELHWEKRRLSEGVEKDLLGRLESGQNVMPDTVNCPVGSCRNPLQVEFLDDRVELSCGNCGFRRTVRPQN